MVEVLEPGRYDLPRASVAAVESVADYENRLYSDVQLAARRSLATMPLAEILTNRNQL